MTSTPASAPMNEPPSAPANSPQPLKKPHKHRWGEKVVISNNKSERECLNGCGIVKVRRHEYGGYREMHWKEFRRGLDRIECKGTPPCEPAGADT